MANKLHAYKHISLSCLLKQTVKTRRTHLAFCCRIDSTIYPQKTEVQLTKTCFNNVEHHTRLAEHQCSVALHHKLSQQRHYEHCLAGCRCSCNHETTLRVRLTLPVGVIFHRLPPTHQESGILPHPPIQQAHTSRLQPMSRDAMPCVTYCNM
jgi:hypothetical protein